jgi:TPP-dependent 2-oxoacid decarboxylase
MPNNDHTRNVSGLLSYAAMKSEAAAQRIDSAIRALLSQKKAVHFNTIATLANVSKTTPCSNPDYRSQIEHLRLNSAVSAPTVPKRSVTDKSKDIILAAKNKRIGELEAEVKRLSGSMTISGSLTVGGTVTAPYFNGPAAGLA